MKGMGLLSINTLLMISLAYLFVWLFQHVYIIIYSLLLLSLCMFLPFCSYFEGHCKETLLLACFYLIRINWQTVYYCAYNHVFGKWTRAVHWIALTNVIETPVFKSPLIISIMNEISFSALFCNVSLQPLFR